MATTREQLENVVSQMKALGDEIDTKTNRGERISAQDRKTLEDQQAEVTRLVAVIKRQNGEHLAVNPSLSESMSYFKSLSEEGGGYRSPFDAIARDFGNSASPIRKARGSAGSDIADFNFSEDQLKELHTATVNRSISAKAAITSTTFPQAGVPDYRMETFPFLRDKQRVLDLLPKLPTNAPSVHYFRALAAATAAAPVAQGATKPESSPTWEEVTAAVRKIAHWASVNDEVIADFDGFLNVVGTEMITGLIDKENSQLIAGTGVGENILGLAADPNILTVGSAGTDLDAIVAAISALRTGPAHCEPDVIVMHPNDWYSSGFILAKATDGSYLVGNPTSGALLQLWGVPVVLSESMTENSALVASLKTAATVYIRTPPVFEVAPASGAEFKANQTLVRAEERLALAIHHPKAVCVVTAV